MKSQKRREQIEKKKQKKRELYAAPGRTSAYAFKKSAQALGYYSIHSPFYRAQTEQEKRLENDLKKIEGENHGQSKEGR